ncbi:alpha/beta fold hydrolase [Piscinibacter sp. XHJ-5]|uniref:alpha/beta fold hydrolase n=1 Tax=Piscinibacter sp. XHJ-5 TaxID=3037797 RepID=UPI0024528D45|nr:alpha/beta fold hydrolase [Piscinibacter sp. XHJ-5]
METDSRLIVALPGFVVDAEQHELRTSSGTRVPLRPQAFAVLECLARRAGQLVSKDELIHEAWPGLVVTDDSLVQCIKLIRRAIADDERRVLQTEPKRGYRLLVTAETEDEGASPARFHQDIRFATSADGVRIAYAVTGDSGPPLVRATHWMTHLEWERHNPVYGPTIHRLSQHHRLLRYDGRGSGLSDRDIPLGTLDEAVEDLAAVVDAAGWDQFALLGRSQGSAISIRYAARNPERVTSLVLLGGLVRGWLRRSKTPPDSDQARAFWQLVENGWGQNNAAFQQLIVSEMFPGADSEQRQAFLTLQRASCTRHDAAQLARMVAECDVSDDLARVRCPTLVLHSPHDLCVPFEQGRLIASSIAGARLEPFDSVNHTPLPGEPAFEQVYDLIDDFLLPQADVLHLPGSAARPELRAVPASTVPRVGTAIRRGDH